MFDLLLILVQNHGRVVEKEALLAKIWPDSFVEEGSITYNIRQLRKALGDEFQAPIYIETVPRRGYRFVGQVDELTASPEIEKTATLPTDQVPDQETTRFSPRLLVALSAFGVMLGGIGLGVWFLGGRATEAAPILSSPFSVEKLSTDGHVYHAAVSPDGTAVVYSRRNAGKQSIWLMQLGTSENTEIVPPADVFYYGLTFSPDGKTIYFTRREGIDQDKEQADVYRESIYGGVPQKIINDTEGWISLSPEGEKISFVRCPKEEGEYCALWIAESSDGRNQTRLLSRPWPIRIGDNRISPDGKTIAFAVGQSRTASNEFGLMEVDIRSGEERELTSEKFFNIKYLAWLPNQKDVILTARKQPDKNFRIWHVSTSTGKASPLTDDSQSYSALSLSEDGNSLISSRVDSNFHLNVYQTDRPNSGPMVLAKASTVNFAPTGRIVFSSPRTGNEEIWSINADGSDERQLTRTSSDDVSPVVSADNNLIFFASNRTGKLQIWKMNQDGTNQTQVTQVEGGSPLAVSRDGRWLYYKSAIEKTIRRVSTGDGREELVFDRPSTDSAISPDGRQVVLSESKDGEKALTVVSANDRRALGDIQVCETQNKSRLSLVVK
jgi:Tol biopolymer transport system component/DNA-binding winged helix-turn-helix (wHTH) protein